MTQDPSLRPGRIFAFWAPMAGTWIMMAVEGPFLAAVIARLAEPTHNLAAFGVAFALAILVEAPVIMILSASTALVEGPITLRRLRRFTYALNAGVTVSMALLVMTPAWDLFSLRVIGLETVVAELTRGALVILLPWPAAIGYRRFYQGLLIRGGRTALIAYGTVLRLSSMAAVGLVLYFGSSLPGSWVGAAALSIGVCVEALAARLMTLSVVREIRGVTRAESGHGASYRGIAAFYLPLALTSVIGLAAQPMITLFVGHARFALESLAVLPVVHSVSFLFRAIGLSYQEVALALLAKGRESFAPVARFALLLAVAASVGQGVIAFTPVADLWLLDLSGLQEDLAVFALLPLRILTIVPALSVMQSLQRAMLVQARVTTAVTWGTVVEVTGILAGLVLTIVGLDLIGATAAAVSFLLGRLAGNLYLIPPCLRLLRQGVRP
jgi:hypothetical protein